MKVKSESEVVQSCPTLRDPMDCSLPGSSIHGIFQEGVLEWGAIDRLGGHKESHTIERLTLSLFFQHRKYLIQQNVICKGLGMHPQVPPSLT